MNHFLAANRIKNCRFGGHFGGQPEPARSPGPIRQNEPLLATNSIKIAVLGIVWWSFWEVFEVLVGVSGDVEEGLQGQFWEGQGRGSGSG